MLLCLGHRYVVSIKIRNRYNRLQFLMISINKIDVHVHARIMPDNLCTSFTEVLEKSCGLTSPRSSLCVVWYSPTTLPFYHLGWPIQ